MVVSLGTVQYMVLQYAIDDAPSSLTLMASSISMLQHDTEQKAMAIHDLVEVFGGEGTVG